MFDSEEGQTYSFDETMESPTAPVNPFMRPMAPGDIEVVNRIIELSEGITAAMITAWEKRDKLRQVIADMCCPWKVGTMLVLGNGLGPMDKRVVTAILPGETEKAEFFRVKTRVVTKGMGVGKKEVNLKLVPGIEIAVTGEFPGVLPPREVIEGERKEV